MKQKTTLTVLMILATLITFGQAPDFKNNRKHEKQFMGLNPHDSRGAQEFAPLKYKNAQIKPDLKSNGTIKQRLDSVIVRLWDENTAQWGGFYRKEEFIFGANAIDVQAVYSDWDEATNQWIYSYKFENSHDVNGNRIQESICNWSEETNQWIINRKNEYSYNASGNMTLHIHYTRDESSSQLVENSKNEYSYNASGNMTLHIHYTRDESSSQLVENFKNEYSYDVNGNTTQSINSSWNNDASQWELDSKGENTYDSNDHITQGIWSSWNNDASQWELDSKDEYSYDSVGQLLFATYYNWSNNSDQWSGTNMSGYSYDADGNMILMITYRMHYTNEWVRSNKYVYEYTINGDVAMYASYDWLVFTNQWRADSRNEYTFNLLFSYADLLLPYEDESLNNMRLAKVASDWDEESNDWLYNTKDIYYYSEQDINSVNEMEVEIAKVYPNPVSDQLTISFSGSYRQATFELFDMQGRKLITKEVRATETIDTKALSDGIYFYNLLINDKKQSGKLIKE